MSEHDGLTKAKSARDSGNRQRNDSAKVIWILNGIAAVCVVSLVVAGAGYFQLRHVSQQNQRLSKQTAAAVSHEIPGLKAQRDDAIRQRDDAYKMLTTQAVPYIQWIAPEFQKRGGDPGQIVLDPNAPPFTPPTTQPKGP